LTPRQAAILAGGNPGGGATRKFGSIQEARQFQARVKNGNT
jgi:hypothetical protein